MMSENKKDHLPLYGIGPALCYPMAVLSAVGIYLSAKRIIPGTVHKGSCAEKGLRTANAKCAIILDGR